jgi:hypothetical protein
MIQQFKQKVKDWWSLRKLKNDIKKIRKDAQKRGHQEARAKLTPEERKWLCID